jgi:hypothetical protein
MSNVTTLPQAKTTTFDLSPQTFEQALTFSNYLADSDMVPKDFKGKPGNCLIAIQWGAEIGLKPLQAMQNLAIINGRPALWGDALIALVRSSGACEYIVETQTATEATCKVKRRGEPEQERTFSMADAKAAGLAGKQGPWSQYPKRMMQMRARAFALRDVFPDVLRGLPVAEEVMDMPRDMGQVETVKPETPDALRKQAEAAAEQGVAAYQKFWKAAGPDNRKLLAGEHDRLKEVAIAADAGRTVDQTTGEITGTTAPVSSVTYESVLAKLNAAKNEDALNIAMDWSNEVSDPEQVKALGARYEELLAAMRGAA